MKVKNYYIERTKQKLSTLYTNIQPSSTYGSTNFSHNLLFKSFRFYIKDCYQNEEDCMQVVKNYGFTLLYVKDQTYEICKFAVAKSISNICYISDLAMKIRIEEEFNIPYHARDVRGKF